MSYHSTYYNCDIYHNVRGYHMGLVWEAYTPKGTVRADTLEGVKKLIRQNVGARKRKTVTSGLLPGYTGRIF